MGTAELFRVSRRKDSERIVASDGIRAPVLRKPRWDFWIDVSSAGVCLVFVSWKREYESIPNPGYAPRQGWFARSGLWHVSTPLLFGGQREPTYHTVDAIFDIAKWIVRHHRKRPHSRFQSNESRLQALARESWKEDSSTIGRIPARPSRWLKQRRRRQQPNEGVKKRQWHPRWLEPWPSWASLRVQYINLSTIIHAYHIRCMEDRVGN